FMEDQLRGFVGQFVGREWLAKRLDDFLKREDRGYFVIEGDTGIGKTAFASWLVAERGYIHHFNIATLSVTSLEQFTRNVTAQLIERYCPNEPEPSDRQCQDGTFLADLLRKVSRALK